MTLQGEKGIVTAPRPGSAWVQRASGTVLARNALNVRCPPGSTVIIVQDAATLVWSIVGRDR